MTTQKFGRMFGGLGLLVFALGWSFGIYFMVDPGSNFRYAGFGPVQNRLANLVQYGTWASLAAGVLWGVAAYLLTRPPPSN